MYTSIRIRECVYGSDRYLFKFNSSPMNTFNWIIIIILIKPKHYKIKIKIKVHYILVHFRPLHNKHYPGPSDGSRTAISRAVELITLPFCNNCFQVLIEIVERWFSWEQGIFNNNHHSMHSIYSTKYQLVSFR